MKLIDALELLRRPVAEDAPDSNVFLACGFTPLHLQTFLAAELKTLLPGHRLAFKTGLFGDLAGSIERLEPSGVDSLVVMIEWEDLDPRLGVRTLGGWRPAAQASIADSAAQMAIRLQRELLAVSRRLKTIVSFPTLPLPPMFSTRLVEAGSFELELHQTIAALSKCLSEMSKVRIASAQRLAEISPLAERYDLKSDLMTGFPYSKSHASALGSLLAGLIASPSPKKGLITDLDDTLWAGILGEDGVDGISWHLEQHTQIHGIYQQFIASLAGAGVLIAVASKNDPAIVGRAFNRSDLLLSKTDIFPFEVHWSRKSESVQRILNSWNVSADSVVFIDNSPMEIAEVKAAFPEMECIVFPKSDYRSVWNVLKHLRDLFGKTLLTDDDAIRLRSIRDAGAWRDATQSTGAAPDEFLKAAEASMIFESVSESAMESGGAEAVRAFELMNKTNQFNLNGKRLSEADWRRFLGDPGAFVFSVSYRDRFGALGKIAVIMGTVRSSGARVTGWVMSCRAFSRRIEHQCLNHLFESLGVDEIVLEYESTPRNGPLQEFLTGLVGKSPEPGIILSKEQFAAKVPPVFHRVEGAVSV